MSCTEGNSNSRSDTIVYGDSITTNVFQHRYYRLNKAMMTLIGQWPYHSTRARHVFTVLLIFFGTYHIFCRILAIVKYRDDWRVLIDCALPFLVDGIVAAKFIGFTKNSQKTLQLLNRIHTDWQVWAQDEEIGILHAYAKRGNQINTVYTAMMFLSTLIAVLPPVIPKIIDVLVRNGTEIGRFPFPAAFYPLDEQKYYFYIIVYCYVCAFMLVLVVVTNEVMLISYVHHGSGIFTALGHKLERIGNDDTSVETGRIPYSRCKRDILYVTSCIDRHNDAIEYVNMIDATYTWTFFVNIGLGMILINVTGLEILGGKSDPKELSRFIALACNILLNFYVDCYMAQILMDRSISIHFSIYNNQWYKVSVKTRKLLQFMSMRSRVPCKLRAGKMLVMSMKTLALTLRTVISYFTFARSLEGI